MDIAASVSTAFSNGPAPRAELLTAARANGAVVMCAALGCAPLVLLVASSGPVALLAFVALGVASALFAIASGVVWARSYPDARLGRLYGAASSAQIAAAAVGNCHWPSPRTSPADTAPGSRCCSAWSS